MFSLIITIISIALVVGLAIATIYYGGDMFTSGNAKAKAATVINESLQIESAIKLYQVEHAGASPTVIGDLVPVYLNAVPTSATWEFGNDQLIATNVDVETCKLANIQVGWTGANPPLCADVTDNSVTICCETTTP